MGRHWGQRGFDRLSWRKNEKKTLEIKKISSGKMDTSEEDDVWDEAAYYAHLDNLDFG